MSHAAAQSQRAAIDEAANAVRTRSTVVPDVALILGTGLADVVDRIDVETEIPYHELPHFPVPTVESHSGRLLLGTLAGARVIALQGRFHRYEGYTLQQVSFPVRVVHALGARTLVVSNASGCVNPLWRRGELMLIDDHINLLGDNPLVGPNLDELGPRFPDMSQAYDPQLGRLAEQVALEERIVLRRGVYAAVAGPNLETRAEYRMLRTAGADAVGMSTVPEVIVARHMNMRVLGVSILTDMCLPDALEPTSLEEILQTARAAEPALTRLLAGVLSSIDTPGTSP